MSRALASAGAVVACLVLAAGCHREAPPPEPICDTPSTAPAGSVPTTPVTAADASLGFVVAGGPPRRVPLATLAESLGVREVATDDPYYGRTKRFRALPLAQVLEEGFGKPRAELAREAFILRARDGYAVPIDGARLFEDGAYLALDDVEVPGFAPIGPAQVAAGPVYMFWTGADQRDVETHPRPWQLDAIELADFETTYPHVLPTGEPPDGPAARGLALFRQSCLRCHAINREGGRVGPELNVPRNILEYRPEEQVRAFIRDPASFRYGNMPAHPGFTDADLDALMAYLRAMATRKHDPGASP